MVARPLLERLAAVGFRPGHELLVETRVVASQPQPLQRAAEELVRAGVEVIVTVSTPAGQAAHAATRSIPIVMAAVSSPVELGLATSLADPGGNVTGVTTSPEGFRGKMLAMLKEAAPAITRVAVLIEPTFQAVRWPEMLAVARTIGVHAIAVTHDDFELLTNQLRQERADALVVLPNARFSVHQRRLAEFALQQRMPTMFGARAAVEAGGLMSHWADWAEIGRKAARLVEKVLKGAKPGTLPIEQPERFDLVLNLRTASAIGVRFPPSLLVQATDVLR